jgi:hypothetical protein
VGIVKRRVVRYDVRPTGGIIVKPEYATWVAQNIKRYGDAYGQCKQVSTKMVAAFPEL